MKDRRVFFANKRIAHVSLKGQVEAEHFAEVAAHQLVVPVADVCSAPRGDRDAQLLMGAGFDVLETHEGWCFGRTVRDGYVGYVLQELLDVATQATHRVTAQISHLYTAPMLKAQELETLSFGSLLKVKAIGEGYAEISSGGFIATQHISGISDRLSDPITFAANFSGTPYLWGGSSAFGIDCSGLIQLCFHAAGRECPRDTDQQESYFVNEVKDAAELKRGDLIFWRGHVALMLNEREIIHANAHHMVVAIEPFEAARNRIGAKEFGEITSMKRP